MRRAGLIVLAVATLTGPASAQQPAPAIRHGLACGGDDPVPRRTRTLVCGDAALRTLDARLATLGAQVVAETAGVDGETGRPIDHYGDEQRAWQRRTLGACRDRACLADAYRARIAAVEIRWGDALNRSRRRGSDR